MDLCKYCSEVVSAELPNRIFEEGKGFLGDAVPHYATFAALSDSAKSCPLCAKFLRGFEGSPNIAAYRTPDSVITKFEVRPYNSGYGDRLELLKHNIMAKYLVCRVDDRPLGACSLLVERDNLMVRRK